MLLTPTEIKVKNLREFIEEFDLQVDFQQWYDTDIDDWEGKDIKGNSIPDDQIIKGFLKDMQGNYMLEQVEDGFLIRKVEYTAYLLPGGDFTDFEDFYDKDLKGKSREEQIQLTQDNYNIEDIKGKVEMHSFDTEAELKAFFLGMETMDGWTAVSELRRETYKFLESLEETQN